MAQTLSLRFHGRLRDFLAREHQREAHVLLNHLPAIKDIIESLGVPHPEAGLILYDGRPLSFSDQVCGDQPVEVFPTLDHPPCPDNPLPQPPADPSFLCDVHLGALARYLRLLGFDTDYRHPDPGDPWLAEQAAREQRVLLTRDLGLLKRGQVVFGYWPRQTSPKLQMREIVSLFKLKPHVRPFTRCADCNMALVSAEKTAVIGRIPPKVAEHYQAFSECRNCQKVFWMGSHYDRMRQMVGKL